MTSRYSQHDQTDKKKPQTITTIARPECNIATLSDVPVILKITVN